MEASTTATPCKDPSDYVTKDYWEILLIWAKGCNPKDVKMERQADGEEILVFTFGAESKSISDDYLHMRPILVDIQDMIRSARGFKQLKHRLCR